MRLGHVRELNTHCGLCRWVGSFDSAEEAHLGMLEHLRDFHERVLVSFVDTKRGREYEGPRWDEETRWR